MIFRRRRAAEILLASCLVLPLASCSSVRMMTPDAAGITANSGGKPRRVRIAGYEKAGGGYEKFNGHVSGAGDSLRFKGVVQDRALAYDVAFSAPRDSVSQIAVKQVSLVRTTLLALGVWAGFAIGVLIAWMASAGL